MKIIIVGCGRVGQTLAEKLNADGNDVTVIDTSSEKIRSVTDRCDVMGVVGNGATHAAQQEAGIDGADLFIAVTNSDELNLLCCLIAKKEGNCQTIARIKNPEYSKETQYLQNELGLVMVINPEYAAAEEIARVLRFPAAIKIEPFGKGRVELIKFRLSPEGLLAGLSVKEMMAKFHPDILVCTVERGDEAYIPNGDFVFKGKDVVSIVATPKNANDFFVKIHYKGHSIKDAIVVGGGVITHYLCEILERSGISIKVIEKDFKTCEEIASRWNKLTVINGNATERELLLEEGIERAGAFVALSQHDEENILLSLFAKEAGVRKLITKINRTDYDSVISRLDLDTVVCPKNVTADSILRYVRATKNSQGSNMETLYNIIEDKVEAAEFIVKEGSPVIGKPLKDLHFKRGVLVASIVRGERVLIPRGHDTIESGDAVVVVTKGQTIDNIADVLER
ncbi:MAG: Trk system potassium transporter TrkA [Clostridia bacterium]|nr:Trk system potassium transporter TrkA [Clostridia bacterium]